MADRPYNVLFLCTRNAARSPMAEVLLNAHGQDRFRAFSAGSSPAGEIHSLTREVLKVAGLPSGGLRSKSWDEFARPDAPAMDFVFTVCDQAAGEVCPVWPGQPMTAHWGFEDPAAFDGSPAERSELFFRVFREIRNRIDIFANLRIEALGRLALQKAVDDIGASRPDSSGPVS